MTPLKPYLIRSIHDWIIDNDLTPHLLVDTSHPQVSVPTAYIEDGKITLNLRPGAINGLELGNERIEFDASFNRQPMHISIPTFSVLAIFAKESGKGMVFDPEEDNIPPEETPPPRRSHLHVVK
ncbi:MAG: ClpXP protease specificity-enhancing factor [Methyloprofundus sp.]|nr:ClpXP protease specificity-enhancing factor [Methyloprofundus sp.]